MDDNSVQIPQPVSSGATDHPDAVQSGTPQAPPLPTGATSDRPSAPPLPTGASYDKPDIQKTDTGDSPAQAIAGEVGDVIKGAGKGLGDTISGLGTLIHKIPGIGGIVPESGLAAEKSMIGKPEGAAQWVGYGGENLAEFMLGDEALKGLSMADKFKQISGVIGILEKSPRLMRAIQMGVDVGKATGELGEEAKAALAKNPLLARLVGTGMDALRTGAVQTAETTAKTGDVGEGVKQGAETGAATGVLGGAFGLLGRAAEKAGEAGKAVQTASEAGAGARTAKETTDVVKNQIDAAEQQMHGDFEAGIQKLSGDLKDQKIPYAGSPLQKAAKATLEGITDKQVIPGKEEATGVLDEFGNQITKQGADKTVRTTKGALPEFGSLAGGSPESKNILTSLADPKKTGDLTIDELVQRRQQLGEKIRQLTKGATSSADRADVAVYQKLRDGIDSTIDSLAKQSGSPEASQDYSALREAYKGKVNLFKEPVVKAIQEGDLDSAGKYLLSGGKVLDKVNTLGQVIGDAGVKNFGKDIVQRTLADASTENGQINPAKFVKDFKKIDSLPPEVKSKLFDLNSVDEGLRKLAGDLKSAANYQKLVRSGVLSTAGAAGATVHPAGGLGVLLGVLGAGDMGKATEVLDKIANNPRLWSAFRTAGKIGATLEPVARKATPALGYGAGNALSNIMQGASQPLSQPDEGQQVVYTNQ